MNTGALAVILVVGTAVLLERFMLSSGNRVYKRKRLITAAGFGVLSIVTALILESQLPHLFGAEELAPVLEGGKGHVAALLLGLAIGFIEELSKFSPFSSYVKSKNYCNSVTEGLILFTTIGLVFGVVETLGYMLMGDLRIGFLRLFILLFFHAALTGIAGFYFAKAYCLKRGMGKAWLALVTVSVIHGFYDYAISSQTALVLVGFILAVSVNCYLFWLYYQANIIDLGLPNTPEPVPVASTPQPVPQVPATPAQTVPAPPTLAAPPPPTTPIPTVPKPQVQTSSAPDNNSPQNGPTSQP